MTAEVIRMHDEIDYIIACPDCGGYSFSIHIDDFDLKAANIIYVECLNRDCGRRVGIKGGEQRI